MLRDSCHATSDLTHSPNLPPHSRHPRRLPALVELSPGDQQQLRTAAGMLSLLQQQAGQPLGAPAIDSVAARQLARELAPLLPQLLPGIAATGLMFGQELGRRTYERVAGVVGLGSEATDASYTPMDP